MSPGSRPQGSDAATAGEQPGACTRDDETVQRAAQMMRANVVGVLPVVERGRLVVAEMQP